MIDNGYLFAKDESKITEELSLFTKVWRRSTEVMNNFQNQSNLIEQVKIEVEKLLKKDKSGHGMKHINNVYNMSLRFAEKEKADRFVISLIALLHEVDDYKLFGKENANDLPNAMMIMNKFKVSPLIQEKVLESIKTIGYKKSLAGIRPVSLEGKIVSDADMCDGIGVMGVLRLYDYQKSYGKPFFDKNIFPNENVNTNTYKIVGESAVCHCFEKLLRLKNMMMTNSGKEEASKRHDIIVSILYQLFEEENVPEWTEYLNNYLKSLNS